MHSYISLKNGNVLCIAVVCGTPEISNRLGRTVGGMETIPHAWPWMVQFKIDHPNYGETHWCGAVLISRQWVASAMHCTYDESPTGEV